MGCRTPDFPGKNDELTPNFARVPNFADTGFRHAPRPRFCSTSAVNSNVPFGSLSPELAAIPWGDPARNSRTRASSCRATNLSIRRLPEEEQVVLKVKPQCCLQVGVEDLEPAIVVMDFCGVVADLLGALVEPRLEIGLHEHMRPSAVRWARASSLRLALGDLQSIGPDRLHDFFSPRIPPRQTLLVVLFLLTGYYSQPRPCVFEYPSVPEHDHISSVT